MFRTYEPSLNLKKEFNEYIEACWPGIKIPENQETEIRLTLYAGVIIAIGEMIGLAKRPDGEECIKELLITIAAETEALNATRY